jgi:uncharacterized membrane protein YadS
VSAVFDTFGDSGDAYGSRRSRIFTKIAHLFPAAAVIVFALIMTNDAGSGFLPNWVSWITIPAYAVVFITAMAHRNLVRICVRCMQDVPADASQQAARKRPLLWIDHHYLTMFLLAIGLQFAASNALVAWSMPRGPSPLFLPADLIFFAQIAAIWTHHRLRPWCPYCRPWDDGHGPRERVPNPDPAGVKTS